MIPNPAAGERDPGAKKLENCATQKQGHGLLKGQKVQRWPRAYVETRKAGPQWRPRPCRRRHNLV